MVHTCFNSLFHFLIFVPFCAFRSLRSRSTKAKVEMAQSLAITSSGIPLIPGADRGFSPDPVSHEEETSSLAMSERSSVGQQLGAAREQATNEASLQKELDTLQKSHGKLMDAQ